MNRHPDFILLNVGHSRLNANWNWSRICSPFARIYLVEGGEARTRMGGEIFHLKPGHLYLIPPFALHDDMCEGHFDLYYIHFYENGPLPESLFDTHLFPMELPATEFHRMLVRRLLEANPDRYLRHIDPQIYDNASSFRRFDADNSKMPLCSTIETQGILYQLMSVFIREMGHKSANKDKRIFQALQYIHANINQNISISQLADLYCMTSDHFIRLFRKEMKLTPLKYINQKKMERAQILLTTTSQTVRQIAVDLSVENVSYFNRLFRQHAGKTPTQFRNDHVNI
ncbi:MAG: AraC family transcriptional regulator [Bacteroidales bacterium 45-6]|nr:MAG: AraC family transcriptional regulator [Bacteroidales bacterium 45-6]